LESRWCILFSNSALGYKHVLINSCLVYLPTTAPNKNQLSGKSTTDPPRSVTLVSLHGEVHKQSCSGTGDGLILRRSIDALRRRSSDGDNNLVMMFSRHIIISGTTGQWTLLGMTQTVRSDEALVRG